MRAVQSRQKAYTDQRHRPLEFSVENKMLLKMSQMEKMVCIDKKTKVDPRCVGPFEVLDKVRAVAYRLALPS